MQTEECPKGTPMTRQITIKRRGTDLGYWWQVKLTDPNGYGVEVRNYRTYSEAKQGHKEMVAKYTSALAKRRRERLADDIELREYFQRRQRSEPCGN